MNSQIRNRIIQTISESIDIPPSAYEKAEARYKDLAEWFSRTDSRCSKFNPKIYTQGSFRLGTVIRPISEDGAYDLDMGCRLGSGVTKASVSQKQLKHLVGADLEDYRVARGISAPKEDKRRCWRLNYADALNFHLDAVPSIPETDIRRQAIQDSVCKAGVSRELAKQVADLTGAITDNKRWNYPVIHDDWKLSNSEGFAKWFEARMKLASVLLENRANNAKKSKIDELPPHEWKSPLQRCVQFLKRHRDVMFADDSDGKPTSIIITTLAARAYNGESEIGDALSGILDKMGGYVNSVSPRVPNPVDPTEDFADRWSDPEMARHDLEGKFWKWLRRAKVDFETLGNGMDAERIATLVKEKLGTPLNVQNLASRIKEGSGSLLKAAAVPAGLSFPNKPLVPQKPAGFAS